jgi:hypothetical protein
MRIVYAAMAAFYVNAGLAAWLVHTEHYGPAVFIGLTAMHMALTGVAAALGVTRTRRPMQVTVYGNSVPDAAAMVRTTLSGDWS